MGVYVPKDVYHQGRKIGFRNGRNYISRNVFKEAKVCVGTLRNCFYATNIGIFMLSLTFHVAI